MSCFVAEFLTDSLSFNVFELPDSSVKSFPPHPASSAAAPTTKIQFILLLYVQPFGKFQKGIILSVSIQRQTIRSPIGPLIAAATQTGLVELRFADSEEPRLSAETELLTETARQLQEFFEGTRKAFTIPLELRGTEFQKKVWNAVLKIPYGSTTSYAQIAERIGNPGAVRAVGAANGRNPIAIIVPCHRVIGSDGELCGYGGGLWRKEKLLSIEGAAAKLPI